MGDTARKRRAIIRRDGPLCHWCDAPPPEGGNHTLDHVILKSMGGSDRIDNLVLACFDCNQARGGVHGPGSHAPGQPSYKANGHEVYVRNTIPTDLDLRYEELGIVAPKHTPVTVSKVKIPKQKPVTPTDVPKEAADLFVEAIEQREMDKALQRLEAKYGKAFKYKEK